MNFAVVMKRRHYLSFARLQQQTVLSVLLLWNLTIITGQTFAGMTNWFDFETSLGGWQVTWNPVTINTQLQRTSTRAFSGQYSMEMQVHLEDLPFYQGGELSVALPPSNLSGQTVIAWVFAPYGASGVPTNRNGLHLFAVDAAKNKLYGTWHRFLTNGWFQIALPISTKPPACGKIIGPSFDPTAVERIGINLGVPEQSGPQAKYVGPIPELLT